MAEDVEKTGAEAGLSRDEQTRVALQAMIDNGGVATSTQIQDAVEARMSPARLSRQGKATLSSYISREAVQAGLVSDPGRGSWAITPEGREFMDSGTEEETTVAATGIEVTAPSNTVRGRAFEVYCEGLVKAIYPGFTWLDSGRYKKNERGLDFVGTEIGAIDGAAKRIGVQVKFHQAEHTPSDAEWLKFLAGCTLRNVSHGVFITTGRLSGAQRSDADRAGITVIEGRDEVDRMAERFGLEPFRLEGQTVIRRTQEEDGYRIMIETISDADTEEFETANVELENLANGRTYSFSTSDLGYAYKLIAEYKQKLAADTDDLPARV